MKPAASSSSSSEYETETESDEEDAYGRRLLKPVFVAAGARDTVAERAAAAGVDDAAEAAAEAAAAARQEETRRLVAAAVAAEDAAAAATAAGGSGAGHVGLDPSAIDTDDEAADPASERAAWEARELARVRRDRAARSRADVAAAERAALAGMTEAEREAAAADRARAEGRDGRRGGDRGPAPKPGARYYHKGAFFQEGADGGGTTAFGGDKIYDRDFLSAPTGEDKFDRAAMPAPMARARPGMWGRRGQQKHTSLADADTTRLAGDDPLKGVGVPDLRGRRGGGGGSGGGGGGGGSHRR